MAPPPTRPAPAPAQVEPPPPEPESPASEPAPAAPSLVVAPGEVPGAVARAIEMLELGEAAAAEELLEAVLRTEPAQRRAQSLLRQIREDPRVLLGRDSFQIRVQPGDTLSRIAQRYLNDALLFYALARYNGIAVPRQLAGGQMIRVPGKAPPPGSEPEPVIPATPAAPPPRAAESSPPPAPPPAPAAAASPPPAPDPAVEAAAQAARAQREREAAIARHTREARSAFAKQDLDGAIRQWDAVLQIDPDNRTAQLERQKALELKDRLQRLK